MPLQVNGVVLDKLTINGVELDKLTLNGIEIFSSYKPPFELGTTGDAWGSVTSVSQRTVNPYTKIKSAVLQISGGKGSGKITYPNGTTKTISKSTTTGSQSYTYLPSEFSLFGAAGSLIEITADWWGGGGISYLYCSLTITY